MNESNENFEGIWFPKDLWLDKNISFIEKGILIIVKTLNKGDDYRWVTNKNLADFLQCSVPTITRAITHLKKLGYIEEVKIGDIGTYRKFRKLKIKDSVDNELEYSGETQKEDEELKQLIEQELERNMLLHPKYYKNVRI